MAFDGGSIIATIKASVDGLKQGIEQAKSQVNGFQQSAKNLSKTMQDTGKKVSSFGKSMTTYITLPLVAAGGAALKFASDAEETQSKFNTVFGDMSETMNDWAETLAKSIGRSRTDIKGWSATLQDTFVPMGMARDQAADLSANLVELAIDVASFNNMADSQVVENFTSAIVGNHQAVAKYGIIINEARLKQEALNHGMDPKNLTENEKAWLRYQIILESSQDAMGDAERTSGSFANQLKGLKSSARDLAEDTGNYLLPPATRFIGWIRQGIDWLSQLNPKIVQIGLVVSGVALVMGPLIFIIGKLITAFGVIAGVIGAVSSPVLIVIAAIAALVAIFATAYRRSEEFRDKVQAAIGMMADFVQGIISRIKDFWDEHGEMIMQAVRNVLNFIVRIFEWALPYILSIVKTVFNTISGVISGAIDVIMGIIRFFSALFTGNWSEMWEAVKDILTGALSIVTSLLEGIIGIVGTVLKVIWDLVKGIPKKLGELLKEVVLNIVRWGLDMNEKARNAALNLVSNIINTVKGLPKQMLQLGKDIIQGLINGIKGMAKGAVDAVKNVGSSIVGGVKKIFGISSPSKIFREFGGNLGEGLVQGIDATERMIRQAADSMSIAATPQFPELATPGVGGISSESVKRFIFELVGGPDNIERSTFLAMLREALRDSQIKQAIDEINFDNVEVVVRPKGRG